MTKKGSAQPGRSAPRPADPTRCSLCGYRWEGTVRDRIQHLRKDHPAYARGVLFRVAAPGVLLVEVMLIAIAHGPSWLYLLALATSYLFLFFGKVRSRSERARAGTTPALPLRRLIRDGGLGFLLVVPVVVLLTVLLLRH